MASNIVHSGVQHIPWTNVSGSPVVSGQIVKLGTSLGVALVDIAAGAVGIVSLDAVVSGAPTVVGAVAAAGEKLLWDVSANTATGGFDDAAASAAAGDLMGAAIAWKPIGSSDTTCTVLLTPGNVTVGT